MAESSPTDVTTLLTEIRAGNERAKSQLVELVYHNLRQAASRLMQHERRDHTLQPTALVHEALVRLLAGQSLDNATNRRYFFGAAVRAMRQVLVDLSRQRAAAKRGGGVMRVPLDDVLDGLQRDGLDLLALDDALEELAAMNARQSEVVMLRFFGGLSMREIAEHLDVSLGTVESDFRISRAWLRAKLDRGG